jgi:hypothetical protein
MWVRVNGSSVWCSVTRRRRFIEGDTDVTLPPLAQRLSFDAPRQAAGLHWTSLRFRKTLWLVAFSALAVALGEMAYGRLVSSNDLLENGADWIYDVVIYGIAALSIGRAKSCEQIAAFGLAAILGVGGFHGAYDVWFEIVDRAHSLADNLETSSAFAIVGSIAEAALLFRFRMSSDPVMKATWFSARNSVLFSAFGAIVPLIFSRFSTHWPQIAVDSLGAFLAFQASFAVMRETLGAR